jgi:hypothetical protein
MFKVALGHSNDPNTDFAIAEVLEQCAATLAGDLPNAGLLICAIDFDHIQILESIHTAYPGIQLVGGTSVGEMSSVMGFQEDSMILMLFCSDDIEIKAGVGRNLSQDEIAATRQAVAQATADLTQPVRLCLTIAEGLGCNASALIRGLVTQLGTTVPIYGGLAGDDWKFNKTYQFFGTEVLTDAVPILLFSGNLFLSFGIATGQRPVGKQGIVTKSQGSTVYEIDGKPALDFYRYYFGDFQATWAASLSVCESHTGPSYLRSPNGEDRQIGSINYFANIPEKAAIQLTQTTETDILNSVDESLQNAIRSYPGKQPAAAFIVSCASRLKQLGTLAREEQQSVDNCFGNKIPSMGFYSLGEISPFYIEGISYFHNETFLTLLMGTC